MAEPDPVGRGVREITVDQHHRPRASGVRAHLAPRQPRAVEALEEPRLSRGVCQRSSSSDRRAACARRRSEEHTSELQSLMRISYAVFCLKKKINFII